MFPGAFESAKSKAPEETLDTLIDKLSAWRDQKKEKRSVALFAIDKDRTREEGNTSIYITGSSATLSNLALGVCTQGEIKNPLAKLFALALMSKIKDNIDNIDNIDDIEDSKHGTDN